MKALVKTPQKNEFKLEERAIPELENDELLVKVDYCGICGSDIHAAAHAPGYQFVPKPIVLGHEFSGKVVEVGDKTSAAYKNVRVIGVPGTFCHECEQCKAGNFAICENIILLGLHHDGAMVEYVKVKKTQVIKIPDSLSSELAALTEPLSVAVHAINRISERLDGKRILVQGCGIIGVFTALISKLKNANVTISGLEKDWEHRLSVANEIGLNTEVFERDEASEEQMDYIFECSGSSVATETGIHRLKKGGKMILVALYEQAVQFPVNVMVRGQIDVLTSYGSTVDDDFYQALQLLKNHQEDFKKLFKIYSLEEGKAAFKDARQQKVLKPILKI